MRQFCVEEVLEKMRTFRWRARRRAVGRKTCWSMRSQALRQARMEDTYFMGVDATRRESVREASTYS
jgi:hypothetical protein